MKMKLLSLGLFLVAIIATISASTVLSTPQLTEKHYQSMFVTFLSNFNKSYEAADFLRRYDIFKSNVDWINEFNADSTNTHTVGINFFTDLTPEEWKPYTGFHSELEYDNPDNVPPVIDGLKEFTSTRGIVNHNDDGNNIVTDDDEPLPDQHDWVELGRTTPIRNQQSCGSCFSFSAMSAIETAHAIANDLTGDDIGHYSTQQGLDCAGFSCRGGFMAPVFAYAMSVGGICREEDYPYRNVQTRCRGNAHCTNKATVNDYFIVRGDEETLKEALTYNSLAIGVTSSTRAFMFYKSGIITHCGNSQYQSPDHAVVMVGYNNKDTVPSFKIRNSWGAGWGEAGHVRVAQGSNVCRIRANVSFPVSKPLKELA